MGTVNGVAGRLPFTRADIAALGASLDNDVHVATGNAYYSFPMVGPFRPYIGAGAGMAFIQNAGFEFALTATAGIRYALTGDAYLALRNRFCRVDGPTDDVGIHYDPIMTHSVMAILGVYLD